LPWLSKIWEGKKKKKEGEGKIATRKGGRKKVCLLVSELGRKEKKGGRDGQFSQRKRKGGNNTSVSPATKDAGPKKGAEERLAVAAGPSRKEGREGKATYHSIQALRGKGEEKRGKTGTPKEGGKKERGKEGCSSFNSLFIRAEKKKERRKGISWMN